MTVKQKLKYLDWKELEYNYKGKSDICIPENLPAGILESECTVFDNDTILTINGAILERLYQYDEIELTDEMLYSCDNEDNYLDIEAEMNIYKG